MIGVVGSLTLTGPLGFAILPAIFRFLIDRGIFFTFIKMAEQRELMHSRMCEQNVCIGDGTVEVTFSTDNWQFFHYDPATMRFAVRPVRGMHKRMIDEIELFLNHEECKNCLWGTQERMVFLMDCHMPDDENFCVFGRHKLMTESDFLEQYPKSISLLL